MSVVADRIKALLDANFVCYETVPHVTDYTALETSEHTHTPGRSFAKAVIILVDHKRLVMAIVPAHHHVDLDVLRDFLAAQHVKLAAEWRLRHHFPDCDSGAIPPFGNLYDMPSYMSPKLEENETVTFNAGSHEMVVSMSFADYRKLVRPTIVPGLSHTYVGS